MQESPSSKNPNAINDDIQSLGQREKANIRAKLWYRNNSNKKYEYNKQWTADNRDKNKKYQKEYKQRLKRWACDAYGGPICACCEEDNIVFLSIDHINGNGNDERKKTGNRGGHQFYQWLKINKYPPGYQVLCFNCNMAKGSLGYCPHRADL